MTNAEKFEEVFGVKPDTYLIVLQGGGIASTKKARWKMIDNLKEAISQAREEKVKIEKTLKYWKVSMHL